MTAASGILKSEGGEGLGEVANRRGETWKIY
jgi:hypothetical protein